jgi:tetratricopeptide (TPR) repeat protein
LAVVGWCWFLGTLVPMIGLVTVGSNGWSARYLYFSIIGLAIAVVDVARGLGGPAWAEWQRRRAGSGQPSAMLRSAPALLAGAWLAVLTATAWLQTAQWRDTPTLAARTFAGSTEPHAHWHVWTWRARYHARRGELAAAADSAERAARLAPHHADAWATLAKYQLGAGRAAAALAHASRAIELDPADAAAALTLATAAFQLRDDTAAARAWAGLGELGYTDRDLAIIFHERGVEHLQAGRDAEAAIDFGIAMDRARDHPRAATNLGLALSRLGLFDAAVAAFREALDRDPGNEAARAGLQDAGAKRAAAAPSRASGGPAREGDEAGRGPGEQGGEEEPPRPPLAEE